MSRSINYIILRTGWSGYFDPEFEKSESTALTALGPTYVSYSQFVQLTAQTTLKSSQEEIGLAVENKQASTLTNLDREGLSSLKNLIASDDSRLVLLTNSATDLTSIPREFLAKTILVLHGISGRDRLDLDCLSSGALVCFGNHIRKEAVAEYVTYCLFDAFYQRPFSESWDRTRTWSRSLISSKRTLVFGYGVIGTHLVQILRSFGSEVDVFDPYVESCVQNLSDVQFKGYDVIILACELSGENRELLDEKVLSQLKSDVVIVNSARGKLVQLEALKKFASKNSSSKVYLDVFPNEPNDFFTAPNIFSSSHIAGYFDNLLIETIEFEKNSLKLFVDNKISELETKYPIYRKP